MTNAITKYEPTTLDDLQRTAKLLATSGYFDAKGSAEMAIAQIATKIMAGAEMGYGPFASVQGIHVIQGKPALSANLMAAAVKGHSRYDYRVRQMDDKAVSIEFFENGESIGVSTFTEKDADRAKTQNMSKFPRNMLFARAMSNGVKWYCPDVFNGNTVYTPEDFDIDSETMRVVDTDTGEIFEPTPKPASNGHEAPADDTKALESARKAFHAAITGAFNGDADDARHWLIQRYTTKQTPDNVRNSTNALTVAELDDLRQSFNKYKDTVVADWKAVVMDKLGVEVYGNEWQKVRAQNVERITKGEGALTIGDYNNLIAGLRKLKAQRNDMAKSEQPQPEAA